MIGEEEALRAYCFHGGCGFIESRCAKSGKCEVASFDEADRIPLRAAISAHLEALKAAGWVVVPRQPTREMLLAYRGGLRSYIQSIPVEDRKRWGTRKRRGADCYDISENEKATARYRAMIAAASPAQNGDEVSPCR
jgi:hypothetical protein